MTQLDQRINQDIDSLIAKLEAIKAQDGKYSMKVRNIEDVAEEARNYVDYWTFKLDDWASDV